MSNRLGAARHRFHRWLSPEQRRGVRIVAIAGAVCLLGVTLTGLWQFFAHESNPSWYGYQPGSGMRIGQSPSGRMAELHSIFGAACAAVAMFGGGWIAYKVVFDVPRAALLALVLAVAGLVTGSVVRYNLIKREGLEYADSGRGYHTVFRSDLEFIVTDRFELGPLAARLWTIGHVLTVPLIVLVIWVGLPRDALDAPDAAPGPESTDRDDTTPSHRRR